MARFRVRNAQEFHKFERKPQKFVQMASNRHHLKHIHAPNAHEEPLRAELRCWATDTRASYTWPNSILTVFVTETGSGTAHFPRLWGSGQPFSVAIDCHETADIVSFTLELPGVWLFQAVLQSGQGLTLKWTPKGSTLTHQKRFVQLFKQLAMYWERYSTQLQHGTTSTPLELPPGYHIWCTCRRSAKWPYCDGAHKGTRFRPVPMAVRESCTLRYCRCGVSGCFPTCDDTCALSFEEKQPTAA